MSIRKSLLWLTLFAVAMAFMESAVVIYLRLLYYPEGFHFPLKTMPPEVGVVEVLREAATVIMLVAVGIFAGKTRLQRFAYFVYAFAIWDLFYYIFLFLCISWPQSLSEWDILFLIPVPWVGPVWAPCLLCLIMIGGACYVIHRTEIDPHFKIMGRDWILMIGGALICILSFVWDFLQYVQNAVLTGLSPAEQLQAFSTYVPREFNTPLFFTGFVLMCLSIFISIKTQQYEKK